MQNLQKIGGGSALIHSAAYLFAIVMYFVVLSLINTLYWWVFSAYWASAFCLVVVALALYERLKDGEPALMQIAAGTAGAGVQA